MADIVDRALDGCALGGFGGQLAIGSVCKGRIVSTVTEHRLASQVERSFGAAQAGDHGVVDVDAPGEKQVGRSDGRGGPFPNSIGHRPGTRHHMADVVHHRAHVIAGGFPPGSSAGHDHDYARLRLLTLLAERQIPASVANDFADMEKWLPMSRLLVTYVAGPYPSAEQCTRLKSWLEAGGHWLALHGTSGGRAERVEGLTQRRTVRTEHHAMLGSMFLTHPPACRFRVDVCDAEHPVTQGLGTSFEVEDEPYFIELQAPASAQILLTADYGAAGQWPVAEKLYGTDTSVQSDGKTRVLGYTRRVGGGGVTYLALGHCHSPYSRMGRSAGAGNEQPATFRGPWEARAFTTLLGNAIAWATA